MRYNIIGDIHGRTSWKKLLIEDGVNIFVGDYFSPYDKRSYESQKKNFLDIMSYAERHPETVTLIGNHDEDHWHIQEHYSRFDAKNCQDIHDTLEQFKDRLQVAYSIENKALVTHAGVSALWYESKTERRFFRMRHLLTDASTIDDAFVGLNIDESTLYTWNNTIYRYDGNRIYEVKHTPDEVAHNINELHKQGRYRVFNFRDNTGPLDGYGDSETHGPLWIRPSSLLLTNIFMGQNYWQIVGHTMFKSPLIHEEYNVAFVDCLEYCSKSVVFDTDTNSFEIITSIPL